MLPAFPFISPLARRGAVSQFLDRQEGKNCGGPFQFFTSFPFLTTIPTQPSPIDLAIGESCQPHDEAMLTRSYTSSIMTTVVVFLS